MPENLPSVVYHYTSMETLKKIAESGKIWATSIRYLNDISERDYAISEIQQRLKQHPDETQKLFVSCFEDENADGSFEDLPSLLSG
jgi:TATA-box binding protein (TBP) (component of TFIID and TFIIIB)